MTEPTPEAHADRNAPEAPETPAATETPAPPETPAATNLPTAPETPAATNLPTAPETPTVTGAQALARAAPDLERRPLLVVSDFDGTLSQIVQDPWAATMLATARRALRRLAGTPGVHVAILSGRTAADVVERARIGGAWYLGNHGLERGRLERGRRAGSLTVQSDPALDAYVDRAATVADLMGRLVREPWLIVERKGPAVAFHYRAAPDLARAAAMVAKAVDDADPDRVFTRFPGRRVLELRPPGAIAKGQATRRLLEELRPAVAFALGDDRSDAEAFTALRRAREGGMTRGLALAVQAHAEAPPEVARSADLLLASPAEAARFLTGLARRVSGVSPRDPTRRVSGVTPQSPVRR